MGPTGVDWAPGLMALVAGLVAGGLLAWRVAGRGGRPLHADKPLETRDLEGKRDALVAQLRELEGTAAKLTPGPLARERYGLELMAARVLQELGGRRAPAAKADKAAPAPTEKAEVPAQPPATPSPIRGFLWGAGSMGGIALLVFFAVQAAKPREEGGSLTGTVPKLGETEAPQDPEEASLKAALARTPDDLDARVDLARVYLGRQDMMGVWNETQYVLARAPGHPRALSYQALVRLAMGQPEVALQMLNQAVAAAPELLEPHLHLALVQLRVGRIAEAEKTMAAAEKRFPDQVPLLKRLMAEMRRRAAAEGEAAPLQGDPHAGLGAPEAGGGVSGTIELAPGLEAPSGALLFVTVREAGVASGPPAAVKRLPAASFPMPFSIGPADSMMGAELPARLRIEARIDPDGDPLTRSPTDPSARLDDVKAGASGLHLILKR